MLELIQNHEVSMRRTAYLIIIAAGLFALSSCRKQAAHIEPTRGHHHHVMEGNRAHVGDEVPVYLSFEKVIEVDFPWPIRAVYAEQVSPVKIAQKDHGLLMKGLSKLKEKGVPVRVILWDGRQYKLRLLPESELHPAERRVVVDR